MRFRSSVALVFLSAAACSGETTAGPIDLPPSFSEGGCPNAAKITPLSATVTIVKGTSKNTAFSLKNICTTSETWSLSATKTGAVASISGPTPAGVTLAGGASVKVFVNVTAGASAGTGTVTLKAVADGPAATYTGFETINVTN